MVVNQSNEDFVKLLPKVMFMLVRMTPSNVYNHENTQEIWASDLKVFEFLQENERSCQNQDPKNTKEWLQ